MKIAVPILLVLSILFISCGADRVPTPKPRSYPKVIYPEKKYVTFDSNFCQFTFEYPAYARVIQDTSFFEDRPMDPCWFNIYVPEFGSLIFCTYYPLSTNKLESVVNDAYKLAGVHNKKASYIDEIPISNGNNVTGFIFDIDGPVASTYQFYVTDSVNHFLRGALYFNARTNQDSLAPVAEFMKKDVIHMLATMKWK